MVEVLASGPFAWIFSYKSEGGVTPLDKSVTDILDGGLGGSSEDPQ